MHDLRMYKIKQSSRSGIWKFTICSLHIGSTGFFSLSLARLSAHTPCFQARKSVRGLLGVFHSKSRKQICRLSLGLCANAPTLLKSVLNTCENAHAVSCTCTRMSSYGEFTVFSSPQFTTSRCHQTVSQNISTSCTVQYTIRNIYCTVLRSLLYY